MSQQRLSSSSSKMLPPTGQSESKIKSEYTTIYTNYLLSYISIYLSIYKYLWQSPIHKLNQKRKLFKKKELSRDLLKKMYILIYLPNSSPSYNVRFLLPLIHIQMKSKTLIGLLVACDSWPLTHNLEASTSAHLGVGCEG